MTNVLVVVADPIWVSVLNRKGQQPGFSNSKVVEFLLMRYLIDVYPKEKETGKKTVIDLNDYNAAVDKFDAILKEVKEARENGINAKSTGK